MVPTRRFPATVDRRATARLVVRDHDGRQLAYVYFDDRRARGRWLVSPGPVSRGPIVLH